MDRIEIIGGRKLKGTVNVSGSKNAALPILIASLLTEDKCILSNVPHLADIETTLSLLEFLGKKTKRIKNQIIIYKDGHLKTTAPYELVRKMRASVLVMGPLLAKLGKVKVSLPGGCAIGSRPIDIHLKGFETLGAQIDLRSGYVEMSAKRLIGKKINFIYPSVGATENILLAAVLAKGKTVIKNAAKEPEIIDLAAVLNKMGAKIKGAGTNKIIIYGVTNLKGFEHTVIPDRIETATYLISAAITKGNIVLKNTSGKYLKAVIKKLKNCGLDIIEKENVIKAKWTKELKPIDIKTDVYPGFPTDIQAQWMALMSVTKGISHIEENVFENRFLHAGEFQRLGANLSVHDNKVVIHGVNYLSGAPVMVSDLRAGAALVLAGLAAKGKTIISRIYHLDRGYEQIEIKLRRLGAKIKRG